MTYRMEEQKVAEHRNVGVQVLCDDDNGQHKQDLQNPRDG
jgi:hypothetical protein